jgi:2-hydroxychromene-2-carboxylate isomerase
MKLTWYFDFISPFAYIQHCQFDRLPKDVTVEYKPILLAGLLNHWENVGPAEIEPKRVFTYKHCYWLAKNNNIAFKMPPAHPFNSLNALRLAIATDCKPESIQIIFNAIWQRGLAIEAASTISYLEEKLGLQDLPTLIKQDSIKAQLRKNTEEAAASSVFGVPTFVPQNNSNEIFWGLDSFEMLIDYVHDPIKFRDLEMQRIETLPVGIQRKT